MEKGTRSEPPKRNKKSRLTYLATDAEITDTFNDKVRRAHGLPHASNTTSTPTDSTTSDLKNILKKSKK